MGARDFPRSSRKKSVLFSLIKNHSSIKLVRSSLLNISHVCFYVFIVFVSVYKSIKKELEQCLANLTLRLINI